MVRYTVYPGSVDALYLLVALHHVVVYVCGGECSAASTLLVPPHHMVGSVEHVVVKVSGLLGW